MPTRANPTMDRRQALLATLCTAAALALLPLPTVAAEPLDVGMGLTGDPRTALKRVLYARVYGAGPRKQAELGGYFMPAQETIIEAERRLFLANGYHAVTQKTRNAFFRQLMAERNLEA